MLHIETLLDFTRLKGLLNQIDPGILQFPARIGRTEGRMTLFQDNHDIEYYTQADPMDDSITHFAASDSTAKAERLRNVKVQVEIVGLMLEGERILQICGGEAKHTSYRITKYFETLKGLYKILEDGLSENGASCCTGEHEEAKRETAVSE